MKKIYLYLIALFGWQIAATAQSTEMPRFIPPSPEVSAMFRYLDYPVSHSTGVPEISIPIYTIQSDSLSLPISISYHAGGRRYSDLTGAIGLGWNLNAGGTIARTVYGRPDGGQRVLFSLKNAGSLSLEKDYEYVAGFYYNLSDRFGDTKDSEYDLFSYSLPGGPSGYFVLTENGPFPLTLNDVKIEGWDNFTITDKKGNKYVFDKFDYTTYSDYVSCKTSWDLTSIVSATGADTIKFSWIYRNIDYWGYLNTNQGFLIPRFSINWCSYPVNNCSSAPYFIGASGASRQPDENEMQKGVLKKIIYPTGGSTEFVYEANRTKYLNNTVLCGGLRINQIKSTSAAGQDILRTFEYGNDGCGTLV